MHDYSAPMKASRGILLVALVLLGAAAVRDVARLGDALPWRQLYDFADFYCAGAALDDRADPYRYEPLHRCEHAVNTADAFRSDPQRVVPAPLPPYDFPPFQAVARLRFDAARAIDAAAIVLAVLASMWGLGLVAGALDLAVFALVLPAGFVLLNAGQVVPFALLALIFCGLALARGRTRAGGVLAALTLIEPHLGLPVCIAVGLWSPRSRASLGVTVLVLAAIALLTAGVSESLEFLTRVLPAQAAAETNFVYQYSLTYLLRDAGLASGPALVGGEISYALLLVLGVWLARRVAQTLQRPELLAYVPAAFSVIAGPYVHMVDLPFAIPAALVLTTALQGRARNIVAIALCLLVVPWILVWTTKKLFLAAVFVVAVLLFRLQIGARVAVPAFVLITASIYALELAPPAALVERVTAASAPGDLAQRAWSAEVASLSATGGAWLLVKIPTWIALACVLLICTVIPRSHAEPRDA